MAGSSRHGSNSRCDINQILLIAKRGWLLSAEIDHILQNHESEEISMSISISDQPPDRPPSGSVFLVNQSNLGNFRRDGRNWRKRRNGKKVLESHQQLKIGGKPALNCYYARGEENKNLRRRFYWRLKQKEPRKALVHYLEVKDQPFGITEPSLNRAYAGSENEENIREIIVRPEDVGEVRTCKFGDKEAPATFEAGGVLQCHTALHEAGRVHNRSARSEEHAFESLTSSGQDEHLFKRLVKLLGNSEMLITCDRVEYLKNEVQDIDTIRYLKNNLCNWLSIQKSDKGGEGLNILDDGGQGVLHLAAALDYDWAIQPTIAAGVSINLGDKNGWTALHWAAYRGRKRTVESLISHGADPELLTYPAATFGLGRAPADLASSNGHTEIAGILRFYALSSHQAAP